MRLMRRSAADSACACVTPCAVRADAGGGERVAQRRAVGRVQRGAQQRRGGAGGGALRGRAARQPQQLPVPPRAEAGVRGRTLSVNLCMQLCHSPHIRDPALPYFHMPPPCNHAHLPLLQILLHNAAEALCLTVIAVHMMYASLQPNVADEGGAGRADRHAIMGLCVRDRWCRQRRRWPTGACSTWPSSSARATCPTRLCRCRPYLAPSPCHHSARASAQTWQQPDFGTANCNTPPYGLLCAPGTGGGDARPEEQLRPGALCAGQQMTPGRAGAALRWASCVRRRHCWAAG